MNIEEVREYGLSLPHATERCPFGPDTLTLEIGGRMFCLMTLNGQWDFYNLKIDPDYSEELRGRFNGIRRLLWRRAGCFATRADTPFLPSGFCKTPEEDSAGIGTH